MRQGDFVEANCQLRSIPLDVRLGGRTSCSGEPYSEFRFPVSSSPIAHPSSLIFMVEFSFSQHSCADGATPVCDWRQSA